MLFKNENGEKMELADNLTLQELTEMGIDISLVEHDRADEQELWQHAANN